MSLFYLYGRIDNIIAKGYSHVECGKISDEDYFVSWTTGTTGFIKELKKILILNDYNIESYHNCQFFRHILTSINKIIIK